MSQGIKTVEKPGCNGLQESLSILSCRTFERIVKSWELSEDEQARLLGAENGATLQEWLGDGRGALPDEVTQRISRLLETSCLLEEALDVPEHVTSWLRTENTAPVFDGGTPLAYLCNVETDADYTLLHGHLMDLSHDHEPFQK